MRVKRWPASGASTTQDNRARRKQTQRIKVVQLVAAWGAAKHLVHSIINHLELERLDLERRSLEDCDELVVDQPADGALLAEDLLGDAEVGRIVQPLRIGILHDDVEAVRESAERPRLHE